MPTDYRIDHAILGYSNVFESSSPKLNILSRVNIHSWLQRTCSGNWGLSINRCKDTSQNCIVVHRLQILGFELFLNNRDATGPRSIKLNQFGRNIYCLFEDKRLILEESTNCRKNRISITDFLMRMQKQILQNCQNYHFLNTVWLCFMWYILKQKVAQLK